MFRKRPLHLLLTALLLICSTALAIGQPEGPPPPDDTPVPITGIEILLGLGALFGVKKIHDIRKKSGRN